MIVRFLEALVELATLARRVTEIDRRLAVETRARTEDTVWLRRELGLHLPTVELPYPCVLCDATHGRELARVSRSIYVPETETFTAAPHRVLKCVTCGNVLLVPVDGVSTEERPS